ncbi:MAG: UvrD-helicase domain-containing protein [Planctomycetota bacterium]
MATDRPDIFSEATTDPLDPSVSFVPDDAEPEQTPSTQDLAEAFGHAKAEADPADAPNTPDSAGQAAGPGAFADADSKEASRDDPLLEGLTPPQRAAVTHVDGAALVLAGPGSGKTRVITRRVAHLVLRHGVAPWNVLAITFTNKAAGEMRERVRSFLSERQARAATISTFHALCARLIRQYAEQLGLPPGYSIYDTADQKRAVKQALDDLEINSKNFPPASMLSAISDAKNKLIDAEAFAASVSDFYQRTVAKVYKRYAKILARNQALDFDDLLLQVNLLLRKFPEVAQELRERFQYVLIDEYQDTNHAQFMLASSLGGHGNVMAVGDPDQSIYGWRGADIQNILEFETHYPNCQLIRLEQNYRSTRSILAVADSLIKHNSGRKHKALWTDNPDGEPARVLACADERHEAKEVVRRLRKLGEERGLKWGEMAVFYRMNSLSRVMEDELRDAGVPYQIARGTAFYDRKEIKDSIAYLRAIANPADEVNLLRIVNTPARGISATTVKSLQAESQATDTALEKVLAATDAVESLSPRARSACARFSKQLADWRSTAGLYEGGFAAPDGLMQPSLRQFVEDVVRASGLEDHYRADKSDPDQERLANLGELVSSAQQFEERYALELSDEDIEEEPTLADKLLSFLERIALVSDVDMVDSGRGAVTLMTLHAAKGLEYPAVAVIGLEEGLLPHERSTREPGGEEEERRLAFVGVTRAEQVLYLSFARRRTIFGQVQPTIPSRFLDEASSEHLVREELVPEEIGRFLSGGGGRRSGSGGRGASSGGGSGLSTGTRIRHRRFGPGVVRSVNKMGGHTRVVVGFDRAGEKTLILEYAGLEPETPVDDWDNVADPVYED